MLTDNVKANRFLLPVALVVFFILFNKIDSRVVSSSYPFGILGASAIFSFVYLFANSYFQPDLDNTPNRPGMGSFPIGGHLMKNGFFKAVFFPLRKGWYYLWEPYSRVLTHRGVSHWPVVGTLTRVAYLYFIIDFASKVVGFINPTTEIMMDLFYLSKASISNPNFLMYGAPIFISDILHSAVDFYDSKKQGYSFCPPAIPRGLIANTINTVSRRRIL